MLAVQLKSICDEETAVAIKLSGAGGAGRVTLVLEGSRWRDGTTFTLHHIATGEDVLPAALLEPATGSIRSELPLEGANLDEMINEYERTLLGEALRRAGGVKKRAAQLLGISFRSFRYRYEKLGLDDDDRSVG